MASGLPRACTTFEDVGPSRPLRVAVQKGLKTGSFSVRPVLSLGSLARTGLDSVLMHVPREVVFMKKTG